MISVPAALTPKALNGSTPELPQVTTFICPRTRRPERVAVIYSYFRSSDVLLFYLLFVDQVTGSSLLTILAAIKASP